MSWTLSDEYLVGDDVGDSLSGELKGLGNVCIYDFDRIVREMAPNAIPKSVDCLAADEEWIYFIEFKRISGDWMKRREIKDSIKLKGVESLHLIMGFMPEIAENRKTFLIVVEQDPRADVTDALTFPDDSFNVPCYLERYMGTDRDGEKLFFDQVASMYSSTFVSYAKMYYSPRQVKTPRFDF